jgi:hypothetical protein
VTAFSSPPARNGAWDADAAAAKGLSARGRRCPSPDGQTTAGRGISSFVCGRLRSSPCSTPARGRRFVRQNPPDRRQLALRIARARDPLIATRERAKAMVGNNGTEPTSNAIPSWNSQSQRRVARHANVWMRRPGGPLPATGVLRTPYGLLDNGDPDPGFYTLHRSRFNGRLRDEFLPETWFTSLMQAGARTTAL